MFLKQLDLTTALRPAYLPDEVLLFVQDNVGLYEGLVGRIYFIAIIVIDPFLRLALHLILWFSL